MPRHPTPTDFKSLMELFGGHLRLAELLKVSRRTSYLWDRENFIPSARWRDIVRVAKECGFEGISYALLASFPRPQAQDAHQP
jgi:hypothetical protein